MSSVRDRREGDVLDVIALLHGVLFCGMYTSELQSFYIVEGVELVGDRCGD